MAVEFFKMPKDSDGKAGGEVVVSCDTKEDTKVRRLWVAAVFSVATSTIGRRHIRHMGTDVAGYSF